MDETETMIATNKREADHQVPTQVTPKMPSVGEFKEIVARHCRN